MDELQRIYDSEFNVSLSWFWDGGIDLTLGDPLNGIVATGTVRTMADVVPWLQTQIRTHFPACAYARSLSA